MELLKPPTTAKYKGPSKRMAKLHLRIRADAITILDEAKEEFGVLDLNTTKALKLLKQSYKSLQMEPFIDKDNWESSRKSRNHSLKIILYAREDNLEEIGAILSDHCLFLQEPAHLQTPYRYCNPHVLLRNDKARTPRYLKTTTEISRFARKVEDILNGFSLTNSLGPLQQNYRIRTALQVYGYPTYS